MGSRLELHNEFIDILGTKGEEESRVYFNTPESIKMKYDCIRYKRVSPDIKRANNKAYHVTNQYKGVIITRDPDSNIPDLMLERFSMCSIGDGYIVDSLTHFPFTLYY